MNITMKKLDLAARDVLPDILSLLRTTPTSAPSSGSPAGNRRWLCSPHSCSSLALSREQNRRPIWSELKQEAPPPRRGTVRGRTDARGRAGRPMATAAGARAMRGGPGRRGNASEALSRRSHRVAQGSAGSTMHLKRVRTVQRLARWNDTAPGTDGRIFSYRARAAVPPSVSREVGAPTRRGAATAAAE
ncbi:uncharacterized protein A4U43_UnF5430 [Asparagus officinalis]|uniref:Uncharacterized protein n=1 Tax=Asparagus officinalis TaxID=4686 RepID=A0A1R3L6P2_ASPOF|nr:uncharacterized protein A4U43_UnF5430 [Asparagus officinalis]